jgi:hypothetical protein
MMKKRALTISMLLLSVAIIVLVIKNFSEIHTDYIYPYEPCLEAATPTLIAKISSTQTPIAYPISPPEETLALPYPAPSLPTATPVFCTCQSGWIDASFSVLTLRYPKEALQSIDSEYIRLRIPTCRGSMHEGFITVRIINNDNDLNVMEFVNQHYSRVDGVKYQEVNVDHVKAVEIYQTTFSNDRTVFVPHHDKVIVITLYAPSSGKSLMPDGDGRIFLRKPDPEALGFFQLIIDSIDLSE